MRWHQAAAAGRGAGWDGGSDGLDWAAVQDRVRIIELAPSREERAHRRHRLRASQIERLARGAWLLPVFVLAAIVAAFALLHHGPERLFAYALGVLFATGFLWIGISIFWPARADRACPGCGREAVERLDPRTTQGLACRACGWRDASASSWFLAEEEGPLEELVLRERAERRRAAQDTGGRA